MVVFVVGGRVLEGTFQDGFDFIKGLLLGGDAEVISCDEAAALSREWLVISVDVEEERGQYAALW